MAMNEQMSEVREVTGASVRVALAEYEADLESSAWLFSCLEIAPYKEAAATAGKMLDESGDDIELISIADKLVFDIRRAFSGVAASRRRLIGALVGRAQERTEPLSVDEAVSLVEEEKARHG